MKDTATITKERAEELRAWVEKVSSHYRHTGLYASNPQLSPIAKHWDCEHDVLAILDDYAALKAEVEESEIHLKDEMYANELLGDVCARALIRAEKAEAELAQLQSACYDGCATGDNVFDELKRTTKERDTLKADLARFQPLIEAAMVDDGEPCFIEVQLRAHMNNEKLERLLQAALKCRDTKKREEEKP